MSYQTNLFINGKVGLGPNAVFSQFSNTLLQYTPATSGETLSIYSPNDDSLVTDQVQVASEKDVDAAVAAARAAFPAWYAVLEMVHLEIYTHHSLEC